MNYSALVEQLREIEHGKKASPFFFKSLEASSDLVSENRKRKRKTTRKQEQELPYVTNNRHQIYEQLVTSPTRQSMDSGLIDEAPVPHQSPMRTTTRRERSSEEAKRPTLVRRSPISMQKKRPRAMPKINPRERRSRIVDQVEPVTNPTLANTEKHMKLQHQIKIVEREMAEELTKAQALIPLTFLFERQLSTSRSREKSLEIIRETLHRLEDHWLVQGWNQWQDYVGQSREAERQNAVANIERVYLGHRGRVFMRAVRQAQVQAQVTRVVSFSTLCQDRRNSVSRLSHGWKTYKCRLAYQDVRDKRKSATLIQRHIRAYRSNLRLLISLLKDQREQGACTKLQAWSRGIRGRRLAQDQRQLQHDYVRALTQISRSDAIAGYYIEYGAAYSLQRWLKAKTRQFRGRRERAQARLDRAASIIQHCVQAYQFRTHFRTYCWQRTCARPLENRAARVIQRVIRSTLCRWRLQTVLAEMRKTRREQRIAAKATSGGGRGKKKKPNASSPSKKQGGFGISLLLNQKLKKNVLTQKNGIPKTQEQEQNQRQDYAALTIQRHFRGMKSRRNMHQLRQRAQRWKEMRAHVILRRTWLRLRERQRLQEEHQAFARIEIQRLGRGFLARQQCRIRRAEVLAAGTLQSFLRRVHLAKVTRGLLSWTETEKSQKLVQLQRWIRHILACQRVLGLRERAKRRLELDKVGQEFVRKIQTRVEHEFLTRCFDDDTTDNTSSFSSCFSEHQAKGWQHPTSSRDAQSCAYADARFDLVQYLFLFCCGSTSNSKSSTFLCEALSFGKLCRPLIQHQVLAKRSLDLIYQKVKDRALKGLNFGQFQQAIVSIMVQYYHYPELDEEDEDGHSLKARAVAVNDFFQDLMIDRKDYVSAILWPAFQTYVSNWIVQLCTRIQSFQRQHQAKTIYYQKYQDHVLAWQNWYEYHASCRLQKSISAWRWRHRHVQAAREMWKKYYDLTSAHYCWKLPHTGYSVWTKPSCFSPLSDVSSEIIPIARVEESLTLYCAYCQASSSSLVDAWCSECDDFFCSECAKSLHKTKQGHTFLPTAHCGCCHAQLASHECQDCHPVVVSSSSSKEVAETPQEQDLNNIHYCQTCFEYTHAQRGELTMHQPKRLLEACSGGLCSKDEHPAPLTAQRICSSCRVFCCATCPLVCCDEAQDQDQDQSSTQYLCHRDHFITITSYLRALKQSEHYQESIQFQKLRAEKRQRSAALKIQRWWMNRHVRLNVGAIQYLVLEKQAEWKQQRQDAAAKKSLVYRSALLLGKAKTLVTDTPEERALASCHVFQRSRLRRKAKTQHVSLETLIQKGSKLPGTFRVESHSAFVVRVNHSSETHDMLLSLNTKQDLVRIHGHVYGLNEPPREDDKEGTSTRCRLVLNQPYRGPTSDNMKVYKVELLLEHEKEALKQEQHQSSQPLSMSLPEEEEEPQTIETVQVVPEEEETTIVPPEEPSRAANDDDDDDDVRMEQSLTKEIPRKKTLEKTPTVSIQNDDLPVNNNNNNAREEEGQGEYRQPEDVLYDSTNPHEPAGDYTEYMTTEQEQYYNQYDGVSYETLEEVQDWYGHSSAQDGEGNQTYYDGVAESIQAEYYNEEPVLSYEDNYGYLDPDIDRGVVESIQAEYYQDSHYYPEEGAYEEEPVLDDYQHYIEAEEGDVDDTYQAEAYPAQEENYIQAAPEAYPATLETYPVQEDYTYQAEEDYRELEEYPPEQGHYTNLAEEDDSQLDYAKVEENDIEAAPTEYPAQEDFSTEDPEGALYADERDYAEAEELSSEWEEVWDEDTGQCYYYNTATGESSWEYPTQA